MVLGQNRESKNRINESGSISNSRVEGSSSRFKFFQELELKSKLECLKSKTLIFFVLPKFHLQASIIISIRHISLSQSPQPLTHKTLSPLLAPFGVRLLVNHGRGSISSGLRARRWASIQATSSESSFLSSSSFGSRFEDTVKRTGAENSVVVYSQILS